jgi:polysaccharide export outer membrane protein
MMVRRSVGLLGLGAAAAVGGCASDNFSELPQGPDAYALIPATSPVAAASYEIGPSDVLSVAVYEEPGMSAPNVVVGADGTINLPLVGAVVAQGKTPAQLSREIEDRLSPRYLVSPSVSVNVTEIVSSKVTVDGEVNQPGVFPVAGPTTLIDVIAMARGTTRVADLDEVAVLRKVNGEQMAARFDLRQIRSGAAANPAIQRGDTIVVGFDALSSAWRDVLSASPLLGIFTRVL